MRRLLPWLIPVVALSAMLWLLNELSGLLGDTGRRFEIGALGSVQFVLNTNAAALTSAMSALISKRSAARRGPATWPRVGQPRPGGSARSATS